MGCGASSGLSKIESSNISRKETTLVPTNDPAKKDPILCITPGTVNVSTSRVAESLLVEGKLMTDKPKRRFSSAVNLLFKPPKGSFSPTRNSLQAISVLSPISPKKKIHSKAEAGPSQKSDVLYKESVVKNRDNIDDSPKVRESKSDAQKVTDLASGRFRIKSSNFTSLERRASLSLGVFATGRIGPVPTLSQNFMADNGMNTQQQESAGKFSGEETRQSSAQFIAQSSCLCGSNNPVVPKDRSTSQNPWGLVKERLAKSKISAIDFNSFFQTSVSVKPLKQSSNLADSLGERQDKNPLICKESSPEAQSQTSSPGQNLRVLYKKRSSIVVGVNLKEPVTPSRLMTRRSTMLGNLEDRASSQLLTIPESARFQKSDSISKKRIRKKKDYLEHLSAIKKIEIRDPISFNFDLTMIGEKQSSVRKRKGSASTSKTPISPNMLSPGRNIPSRSANQALQLSLHCVPENKHTGENKVSINPFGMKGTSYRNLLLPEGTAELSPRKRRFLRQSQDLESADLGHDRKIKGSEFSNSQSQYSPPQA